MRDNNDEDREGGRGHRRGQTNLARRNAKRANEVVEVLDHFLNQDDQMRQGLRSVWDRQQKQSSINASHVLE